jgi:putative transposase
MKRVYLSYAACSYITSVTRNRIPFFQDKENIIILLNTFSFYRERGDFKLFGYVIMPDHFHTAMLPLKGTISDIMRNIKAYTGNVLRNRMGIDYDIWQDSFYDHKILDKKDLITKLNYMHENPLRKGIVRDLSDYYYSSYINFYTDKRPFLEIDKIE